MIESTEIRKAIMASETKEIIEILESLDENSRLLAKTYLSALLDRQQLERLKISVTKSVSMMKKGDYTDK